MRVAVALLLASLFLVPSADAKRTGVISVFAITKVGLVREGNLFESKAVRDKRGRRIGTISQICTLLPRGRQECFGTLAMPLGKLTFAGTRSSRRYYVFAITGGTGAYSGSSGQYASTTISLEPRVEYVLVSLVP